MSQYEASTAMFLEMRIGWDPPLQTFFGQVRNPLLDEEQNPIVWVGTKPRELYEIEDLERAMPSYARDFVRSKAVRLYADKDENR